MSGHTPGPWQVSGVRRKWREPHSDQLLDAHSVGPDGDPVALVFYAPKWHLEQRANARLIAAAPDLLEALKRVIVRGPAGVVECRGDKCREPWCASCRGWEEAEEGFARVEAEFDAARAAIAKAEGRS